MRLGWITALAAMVVPGTAMAQDTPRKLLFSTHGIAVFVSEPVTGPRERRLLEMMPVFLEVIDDGDVHLNPWVVDCTTMSVQPLDGRAYLGTAFVKDTQIAAPMKPAEPGTMERGLADYACSGKRVSSDDITLRTFAEAVDYGRKRARE